MIKTLVLLISLLLATLAWGETKYLTCDVVEEDVGEYLIEIAFDLELKKFEINLESSDESEVYNIDPGILTVFPTFLSFLFLMDDDPIKLDLNREDLMATLYEPPEGEYMPRSTIFESFKCQLVRGKKNQI